jgi:hypothetical protein
MTAKSTPPHREMKACRAVGPIVQMPTTDAEANKRTVIARCNRPEGHDGKHAFSTMNRARVAEWDTPRKKDA